MWSEDGAMLIQDGIEEICEKLGRVVMVEMQYKSNRMKMKFWDVENKKEMDRRNVLIVCYQNTELYNNEMKLQYKSKFLLNANGEPNVVKLKMMLKWKLKRLLDKGDSQGRWIKVEERNKPTKLMA